MLLSRFWYFLLAAAFGASLTAALLAQAIFNRQYDNDLANELVRDRVELELWLRLDARSRLDAITPLAADGEVRSALRKANAREERHVDPKDGRELEERLRSLNKQLDEMEGDLLFALDGDGVIVAQLGTSDPPPGAGLGAFPLVEKALSGYVRDDVWVYNQNVYRMAARPVIDRGRYVGALVHGMIVDNQFAQTIGARVPGASVGFFQEDRMVASHMPAVENAARAPEMEKPLGEVLGSEKLHEGERTEPMSIGEHARAVYSLVSGSAAHADVGYAVARPRYVIVSPFEVFDRASAQDVEDLDWLVAAGLPLLLFLLGMLWVVLERDRPLVRLRNRTADLAQRSVERLDLGVFRGKYRRVAENVNEAMDKAVSKAAEGGARAPADLDQILGPSGGESKGGGYFGFAQEQEQEQERGDIPSVPPPPGTGAAPAPPKAPPAPPSPGTEGPTAKRPAAPEPPRPPAPPAPPQAPPAPPQAPPAQAPDAPETPKAPEPPAQAGPPPEVPGPPAPPKAPPAPPKAPPAPPQAPAAPPAAAGPAPDWDDDEGATMVADVPDDLLAQSSSGPQDEEEQHFKQVFEQYVQTKKECGEPTAGLTFDKFAQTLRKNRDQIVQKHGAKKVRFTVYTKDGKAALKATPVKS